MRPDDSLIPVIIAVGDVADRPADPAQAREPVALMADALRQAEADGGVPLLSHLTSIDLVGQATWRYRDPVGLLCQTLGIHPARRVNASMGGETPIRLIHDAALRIAGGSGDCAAIVGGEAMNALGKARKAGIRLPWTPVPPREEGVKVDFDRLPFHASARAVGVSDPVHVYPLYENALAATRGQTPAAAHAEAAALWSRYAAVAADNPLAWLRSAPAATEIATTGEQNRMVCFPYPKLMVANPSVNQAAAIIVTSLAKAKALGIAADRLVYPLGGAAAQEPPDFLARDHFDRSTAQDAVLRAATGLVGGDAGAFDLLELYSCFPVVPKLALATLAELGLPTDTCPTVAGGLTFFGGPLNNYMSHATCAMVRALRAERGGRGLLYGQGGVVSKHHALVLSAAPPDAPLAESYSVQAAADAARGPVAALAENYTGPASVETHTFIHGPKGQPLQGIVVARTPDGRRLIARTLPDDAQTLALLTDWQESPVGAQGHVRIDTYGIAVWEAGGRRDRRQRPPRHALVERDGPITIVTINRPDVMNALHPAANEELAEIFDDFQADPQQWVAILTGAGDKAFCAGNDLKYMAGALARGEPVGPPLAGFAGITSRWDLTKPVIAAVNGLALGGGFEIALACDILLAADTASFALPEPKVGLAALAGGLHRLPRQIGMKAAMGMILTGRRVGASEGQALGFVNEVVAQAALMDTARRWAAEIVANSPMAVRASKQAVMAGLDESSLRAAYEGQMRYPAVRALFRSHDFREGPLAFARKRPPVWKGE